MAKKKTARKTTAKNAPARNSTPRQRAAALPAPPEFRKIPSWFFFVVLAAILVGGYVGYTGKALYSWAVMFALFFAFLVMAGYNIKGVPRGAFIDRRNRISLANLQMVTWTILATSGYLAALCYNMKFYDGGVDFFSVGIPQELWLLMGISTTTLVGSPLLLENKRRTSQLDSKEKKEAENRLKDLGEESVVVESAVATKKNPSDAAWSDMWKGEDAQNAGHLDISRVQMFFFTFIVFAGYAFQLGVMFWGAQGEGQSGAITQLPAISTGMLTLLGISHAGYLGKKSMAESKGTIVTK